MTISTRRIVVVLALFALTFAGLQFSQTVRETPLKKPLSGFPLEIGDWKFVGKNFFSAPVIEMLGVADYISYDYADRHGGLVNLYISYFTAVGVTGGYHSPQNCLPGGGWNIASVEDVQPSGVPEPFRGSAIKRVVVQKGGEQQLVLYWFQNRGRVIASEYWEKIYLVTDAVLKQRRDGSFIRIIGQPPKGADPEKFAQEMVDFAARVMGLAADFIPGA
ncbi:MAG: exosortase C-terminal domain/associated protein EpsI [Desulfobacterales bacterium]